MAYDGIVTKAIASELQTLSGARIDKIFQPNKNTILLGFYFDGTNYLLNICVDSSNYRVHLTTHPKPNPKIAPNFCMVLRKHLLGLRIKNIITNHLERLIIIDLEGFDDVDDIISKRLIIELMGKHCNVILLDDQNVIIDSLRHIHNEDSTRAIVPHVKYTYPTTNKFNFLDCPTFEDFYQKLSSNQLIHETFNGISKTFIEASLKHLNLAELNQATLKTMYEYTKKIIDKTDGNSLEFQIINDKKKDYFLIETANSKPFHLNFFLDDFYDEKENLQEFKSTRDSILKIILDLLKKYKTRLLHINEKLASCENMEQYQLYGELIIANLYQIKNENTNEIRLTNYYNNEEITIPLDCRYTPSINAKRFFKKYQKLKNTLEIVSLQKEETLKELSYIESIVYELENCRSMEEVSEIFEEISEHVIFKEKTQHLAKPKKAKVKKSSLTKNKNVSFNPLKYKIDGYTLLVGRNNKENDYLTLKYAQKTDLWFHTKDIPSSHAILQLPTNTEVEQSILLKCAEIVAFHSKAKNSSHVPVDFCQVKFVKKPNSAKPGMVIYTQNKTLFVNPKDKN
ncbi:MAG: fibronectin/fibrinogen-binding protein [Clostridia bacterium]|nr:fibronectin/fibrinogen-binding protein [Clostridia bacterium]